jgi:hypothetical protein
MKDKKLDLENKAIPKPLKFSKEFIAKRKAHGDALAQALSANLNRVVLERDAEEKAKKLADDERLKLKTKELIDNLNRKVLEEQAQDKAEASRKKNTK